MRTRRAPIGPDGVELSTTRPTASSTRAAAPSTASKKRKEPAATPSRSTHSRVPSTRTPLATKNAHSSSQPSSTGLLQPGSDILLANVFNNAAAEEEEEEDEPVKKKSKKAAAAADLAGSPKVSSTRRSLAELVDDALRPVEDQGRVRSTTTRVTLMGGVQNAQKAPSVSSTASGSVKSTSVASLLSNRRNQRGQVKKTVAPTGFYAQAAPPPPLPRVTRPTATSNKAALKSNKVATTSKRTLLSSPAPEEEEEEEDDVPATTSSKVSRPPLQAIAPELVPTPKTGPSQARSTSTNTNLSLFSNPPTLAKRRTGMVVWDNDDDDEDEDQDVDDDEDLSDEEDQKKGDDKDVVNLSPGSSDKENRDPLAGQTSLSRTAVGTTNTQRTVAPPPSPPTLAGGTPVRPKGDLKTTKTRTPLSILADIGPSHSTPLSGGKVAKPLSDKKGKGVVREQPSLSIVNKSHSSSTTSSGAALLAVPETNTQELSSSIPASDDVFLYAKPSDVVVGSGAMDDVREEEAEEGDGGDAVPSDHDEIIRDLGLEPDVPILEDFEMDDSPVDMAGLDDIQWPSHEDAGAALAGPFHAEVDDDDFDFGDAADSEDGVENGKVSYDQENDPFGFFAAEAKLRARRQEERIRQSSEVGQAKVDDVEEEEEEGRENGEVYGLDLRTEQKAFASSSPVPSDDENEDEDDRVKETRPTLKKASATEGKDDAPDASAVTAADESQSPVRRSVRAQKKKEAVIGISDSESEEQVPIKKKKTMSTKTTKGKKKKEEQDSDQYDTDLPPPGFTRSAAEIRRRGAGGMRNGRAQADFVDEPFDSDDERPSRSTSGSSSSFGTKGKGKGKGKGGAVATKEARLSDLVKLLPKRATASTYGSKKGNKGARVTSTQSRKTSNTISASKASPVRGRGRERSSSVESVSSLPSPKAVLERSKKSRGLDVQESEKEEDVFSADSGDEEEEQRASAKTKGRTATRSKVAAASSSSAKAKATAKVQAGTTKGKKKKAGALPEWCNEKKKEEEGVKARSVSSSSRKRRRGDDVEEEEESSEGESESEVEEVVEVKNGGRKAKQAKAAAPSKGKGRSVAKETGTAKKTGALGKKRVPSKTQVDRPRDDLDDFELDTELVI
ncbi:hypothetical protein CF327_g5751 [Tilletia walkeri]|uniref:Uncharacterized protein n=1 Tax=Tilletia walkeri TaxID=117179 RepID=A0A8X7T4U5_9BASI|nr:hypothetical protein CF327_g5751 [Tilletia walkeri]KAE8267708.1 hypothetical protein A4X09_0g4638 [Tilletia walkeri]